MTTKTLEQIVGDALDEAWCAARDADHQEFLCLHDDTLQAVRQYAAGVGGVRIATATPESIQGTIEDAAITYANGHAVDFGKIALDLMDRIQPAERQNGAPLVPDDESLLDLWVSVSDAHGIAYDGPSFEAGYKSAAPTQSTQQPDFIDTSRESYMQMDGTSQQPDDWGINKSTFKVTQQPDEIVPGGPYTNVDEMFEKILAQQPDAGEPHAADLYRMWNELSNTHYTMAKQIPEFTRRVLARYAPPHSPMADSGELRKIGFEMSNVAYNWAQCPGKVLSERDCKILRDLAKRWDDAQPKADRGDAKDQIESLDLENHRLRREISYFVDLLPGPYYMDPPDGGDVQVPEQFRRMSKDAARYRWLRGPDQESTRYSCWRIEYWDGPNGWQPMQRERMDAAIDAALAAQPKDSGVGE